MLNFESDTQFTNYLHYIITHRIQGSIWDMLSWLDYRYEIDSLNDLLRYIRLVADYGDAHQGRMFFDLIKENKHLKNVSPEIATRYVRRGQDPNYHWLRDLGHLVQSLQEPKKQS